MPNYNAAQAYAVGRELNEMVSLDLMGVGAPDQVVYAPYATRYELANFQRVGDGFPSVVWIWDIISQGRLSVLLDYLDGAQSASVYINTQERTGKKPQPASEFFTFSAVMIEPDLSGSEGVPVARSAYAFQTVQIQFRKLVKQGGLYSEP